MTSMTPTVEQSSPLYVLMYMQFSRYRACITMYQCTSWVRINAVVAFAFYSSI